MDWGECARDVDEDGGGVFDDWFSMVQRVNCLMVQTHALVQSVPLGYVLDDPRTLETGSGQRQHSFWKSLRHTSAIIYKNIFFTSSPSSSSILNIEVSFTEVFGWAVKSWASDA